MYATLARRAQVVAPPHPTEANRPVTVRAADAVRKVTEFLDLVIDPRGFLSLKFATRTNSDEIGTIPVFRGAFMMRLLGRRPQQCRGDLGEQLIAPAATVDVIVARQTAVVVFTTHLRDLEIARGPSIPEGSIYLWSSDQTKRLRHTVREIRFPDVLIWGETGRVLLPTIAAMLDRRRQPLL